MSSIHKIKINCPKCGKELEVDIYNSINVTVSPELLEKVLDFSVFNKVCDKCNSCLPIEYSCMFHDMDKKYIIWSTSGIEDIEKLFDESKFWLTQGYKLRFVEKNHDIVEKVSMLKYELKDTVIEFIKLQVCVQLDGDKAEETINDIRFLEIEGDNLIFGKFIEDKVMHIEVPLEKYNKYVVKIPEDIYKPGQIESVFVTPYHVANYIIENDILK